MRIERVIWSAAAALALVLAGCSSEPAAVGSAETAAESTAGPDDHHSDGHDDGHEHTHEDDSDHGGEGPPPPPAPYIAEEESLQGASAFTTYFFEVVEHAYANRQTSHLERLVTPECAGCAASLGEITDARAHGERYQGGATHVLTAVVRDGEVDSGGTTVDATVTVEGRVRTNDVTGEVVERDRARNEAPFELVLERVEDEWRVARLEPVGTS